MRESPLSPTQTLPTRPVLFDERVLVALLIGERLPISQSSERFTTSYFYFRACRAFVLGASGKLSGPFKALDSERQALALGEMLALPDDVGLPDPRSLVPVMIEVQGRHPQLTLLNTEAVAAALLLNARLVLTAPTARGQLADVLEAESINWSVVELP